MYRGKAQVDETQVDSSKVIHPMADESKVDSSMAADESKVDSSKRLKLNDATSVESCRTKIIDISCFVDLTRSALIHAQLQVAVAQSRAAEKAITVDNMAVVSMEVLRFRCWRRQTNGQGTGRTGDGTDGTGTNRRQAAR